MERTHYTRTYARSWTKKGFLPQEAEFLKEISKDGRKSPVIKGLMKSREDLIDSLPKRHGRRKLENLILNKYAAAGIKPFVGTDKVHRRKDALVRQYIDKYFYDYLNRLKRDYTDLHPGWKGTPRPKSTKTGTSKPQMTAAKAVENKVSALREKYSRAVMNKDMRDANRIQIEIDALNKKLGK